MTMSKDEAVATLKAMFDEWDTLSLADVVDMSKGNLDLACEIVLQAGNAEGLRKMKADNERAAAERQQQQLQQQQQQAAATRSVPAGAPGAPAGQKMVQVSVPAGTAPGAMLAIQNEGRQFLVRVPPNVNPGGVFYAAIPDASKPGVAVPHEVHQAITGAFSGGQQAVVPETLNKGRGTLVRLPDDFLRPPGYKKGAVGDGAGGDDALARALQNQLFLDELRNYPEFAQLYSQPAAAPPIAGGGAAASASSAAARSQNVQQSGEVRKKISTMGSDMRARLNQMARRFQGGNKGTGGRDQEYAQFNNHDSSTFWAEEDDEGGEMVTMEPTSSAMHSSESAGRPGPGPGSPSGLETVRL